jgi:hypothetical protein
MNSAINRFCQTIFDKIKLKQLDMSTIISRPEFKAKYDNYIGGKFVAPLMENIDVILLMEK